MVAVYNFFTAYEGLGYIWCFDQTGMIDYEKAILLRSKRGMYDDFLSLSLLK